MSRFQRTEPALEDSVLSVHEGAVSRVVPYLLGESQVVDIQNLVINKVGLRERRDGAFAFGGLGGAPGGLSSYVDEDGVEQLVGVWDNRIYTSSGNGGWAQVGSACSLVSGHLHQIQRVLTNSKLAVAFVSAQDPTTVSLGEGKLSDLVVYNIEDDAATCVSLGGRCTAAFQNRLWVGAGQNLYWSDINEPASFSLAGNFITLEPGTGDDLTAILPSRGDAPQLWLFKKSALFLFEPRWGASSAFIPVAGDGLDVINSRVRTLTRDIGCIATKSLKWVPGAEGADAFFLAQDGVRSLARAQDDQEAGAGFPITWNVPAWVDRINFTHAHKAAAAVFDNAYHLAVPLDGAIENTHVLRYDFRFNAWSLHNWQAKDCDAIELGEDLRFFFQSNITSTDTSTTEAAGDAVYQVFQGYRGDLDPGAARIEWFEESRGFILQEARRKKHWESIEFNVASAQTSTILVEGRVDQGAWVDLETETIPGSEDSIVLGETALPWRYSDDVIRRRQIHARDILSGRFLQIRLGSGTATSDVGKPKLYQLDIIAHSDSLKHEDEA